MTRYIFLFFVLIATTLSSCITSLHRLNTYTTVTTDAGITGNWQYKDTRLRIENLPASQFYKAITSDTTGGKEKKSAYDSKEDSLLYSKSYVIEFINGPYQYYMICSLTRLRNELFADIEPVAATSLKNPGNEDENLFSHGSYTTTHSFAKLMISGNAIEFRFLDGGFISEQLNSGRVAMKYEKDDVFQTSLITASTKDLRQFLTKYGKDQRLYNKENTVTLTKI